MPNIKNAGAIDFAQFLAAYDDVVKRARDGKLGLPDFQGTTISLTNPGTLGTVASDPAPDGRAVGHHRHRRDRLPGRVPRDAPRALSPLRHQQGR